MHLDICRTFFFTTIVGALSTFTASVNAQVSATRYEVVDIGALTALPFSAGFSVSNSGFVAGLASNGINFQQGFIWREQTGLQWLSHPSSGAVGESVAHEVNDAGQVIGYAFDPNDGGVLWNADGSVNYVFQSQAIDAPTGLNNFGVVTGYRNTPTSQTAFIWNGSYTDLGSPPPPTSSQGYDVNDAGQVAGLLYAGQGPGVPKAFLWSAASGFTTITTSPSFSQAGVSDLSNTGTIVGSGSEGGGGGANSTAWRWDALTGFSLLSSLSATREEALAVNDSGVIAGRSGPFGTIWDEQGNIDKVDDLLAPAWFDWKITTLRGINNSGWLTGEALPPGSANHHAVLLRPVPEPAAIGLIVLSCAPLLARRRRPRERSPLPAPPLVRD